MLRVCDPPVIRRCIEYHAPIKLEDIYRVRVSLFGDGENFGKYEDHIIQRGTSMNPDTASGQTTMHRVQLRSVPGMRYTVRATLDCSSGDTLTNETEFTTAKPSCTYHRNRK